MTTVVPSDTVANAAATPDHTQPYRELGLKRRRVRPHPGDPRPPSHRRRAGHVRGHVERALLLQVLQGAPAPLRRDDHAGDAGAHARGHRRERGRRRRSATAGPSPSRSSRTTTRPTSSRTRARPPGSAASCATSWPWARGRSRSSTRCASARPTRPTRGGCCPAWSPASAATATAWACPTSAARSSSTPATRATRWSTRCAWACCAPRTCTWRSPPAPATRSSCSARAPGSTASAGSPCWPARPSTATSTGRPAARSCPVGPGRRPVHREGAHRVLPRAVRRPGLVVGIQDLGGAGLSCATSELASAGDGGMRVDLDAVPLRATGMTPAEILSSESQERMCAVVRARQTSTAFLAICAKWDVLATVIGEVTDGDRLVITWHGETVVDVPPRTVAHDGPVYQRPMARPERPGRAGRRRPGHACPARRPRRAAGGRSSGWPPARTSRSRAWVTDQYDRYVRGNTVLRPARRRRGDPDRRGHRPRRRRRHRLQRPLRRARPVRRRPARAGRGVPQRRGRRRRAGRRHQLPQLRLARGPARDVAVRRGRARARRRLRRARHPGHRRQRQLLQPDRRPRDPADAGGGRARRARRRRAAGADGVLPRRRRDRPARGDPRGVRRQRVGARRARAPGWAAARGRPGRRAAPRRAARRRGRRRAAHQRARPLRRRPGAGVGRVVPASAARGR